MVFPMNVEKQLQICDVLAGAASAYVRRSGESGTEADYHDRLIEAGLQDLHIGGLWPSTEMPKDHEEMSGLDANKAIE